MQKVKLTRGDRFKDARIVYNQHGKQPMDEVEKATGVPKSTIHKLESEKDEDVYSGTVVKLAEHYGVSTDYLLGTSEIRTTDPELREVCDYTHLSEEVINLARLTATVPYAINLLAAKYDGDPNNLRQVPLYSFASAFLNVVKVSLSALPATKEKAEDAATMEAELGSALYRFNRACIDLPNAVMLSDDTLDELHKLSKELETKMILAIVASQGEKEANNGEHQED